MFSEKEVKKQAKLEVGTVLLMLQLLARMQMECRRLNGSASIADSELSIVGQARDAMVNSVKDATGKDYDEVRSAAILAAQKSTESQDAAGKKE